MTVLYIGHRYWNERANASRCIRMTRLHPLRPGAGSGTSGSRQRRAGGGGAAEVPGEREAAAMPAFRQVGEKQLPQEVVVMAWSPKRDLIALANRAGEVSAARGGGQPAAPALGRGVRAQRCAARGAGRES